MAALSDAGEEGRHARVCTPATGSSRLALITRLTALEAAVIRARTDSVAARHLLTLLTHGCRTRDRFEQERAYLFGADIPAEYLPTAAELGRADLR